MQLVIKLTWNHGIKRLEMFLTNPCLCANTIHKPTDKFCNLVRNSSIIFVIHVAFISTTVCNTAADFTAS